MCNTVQNGEPVEVEETLVPEPQNRSPSALLRPEKYLKPKSGNWESQAEFSTAGLRESRAVQPNSHPAGPSGLSVSRGAELREVTWSDCVYPVCLSGAASVPPPSFLVLVCFQARSHVSLALASLDLSVALLSVP